MSEVELDNGGGVVQGDGLPLIPLPMHLTKLFMAATLLATAAVAAENTMEGPGTLGLQLWSLRDTTKVDAMKALDQARDFGFTAVETAGTAGMSAADFKKELDARGLVATAAHVQYGEMEKDLAKVVSDVKTLGAKVAFCPWIPHKDTFTVEDAKKASEHFNQWAAAFQAAGIQFGYHLHGYEFAPGTKAGEYLLDDMMRWTDAKKVVFQLDVVWVVHSGVDPAALMQKYPGRFVSLHVKDLRKGAEIVPGSPHAPATDQVVVGTGMVDWKKVVSTAKAQGISHFILEDETPAPLTNIPASLKYWKSLKL